MKTPNYPALGTKVVLKTDNRSLRIIFSAVGGLLAPNVHYTVWGVTYDDDGKRVLITLQEHQANGDGVPLWLPFNCFAVDDCYCPHNPHHHR